MPGIIGPKVALAPVAEAGLRPSLDSWMMRSRSDRDGSCSHRPSLPLGFYSSSTSLIDLPAVPIVVALVVSWLGLVWLMNVYNFMDGVDGMAATGAILMSASVIAGIATTRVVGR